MIGETSYKQGKDDILRHCVYQNKARFILEGCHLDSCGGHFTGDSTARKALMVGYW